MKIIGAITLSHDQIVEHLAENNYFAIRGITDYEKIDAGSSVMAEVVTDYQERHGLVPDAFPGSMTQFQMELPRCGMPDHIFEAANQPRWPENCLTVPTSHRLGSLLGLTPDQIQQCWEAAIAEISIHSKLTLTYVMEMEAAKIWANPGAMGRGTLAWSYLANNDCSYRPEQQYNKAVQWSMALLLDTMVHEILHACGLGHGPAGSIMQPTASGSFNGKMRAWDIAELVSRHGVRETPPPTPPPVPPGPDYQPLGEYEGWLRRKSA